ncbi:V-type ATPase 116kDa subunit family protein [Plantactinospora sp. WMMB334]|uniref:V-type ATPase 116kDa subunit family protein n=1 Tax=Plantactinospora sp. WMMB334 TaxID=3404119 RepID=UPI003B93003F
MRLPEPTSPLAMTRVALVAPREALRDLLVRVADTGAVEIDQVTHPADLPRSDAARALQRVPGPGLPPALSATPPDLAELVRAGRTDLLAGEDELSGYAAQAVVHGRVAALVGWTPTARLPALAARLAEIGAAAAPLPPPRGVDPPSTPGTGAARRAFGPLVDTYATVPYRDVDPSVPAGIAYALMFGAMFGDAGHGALLILLALLVRSGRLLGALRPHWLFVAAAGACATLFGLAYGEFFGPTGVVPVLWLAPMEQPVPLLLAAVGLGAVLLAGAYGLGIVNRLREGGWALALYAPSGFAGALLFVAAALGVAAWYWHRPALAAGAGAMALLGAVLAFTGLRAGSGGGPAGTVQAAVELFDLAARLGANIASFARLAAFGLTHAVLGWIVWDASTALWDGGGPLPAVAVLVFLLGNALSFGLEALVAGIQALRLAYYELFSRVFRSEGRPFRPWRIPTAPADSPEEASCPAGAP